MSRKPQPEEYTEAQVRLMRAMGMNINDETNEVSCSGRPGVVYVNHQGEVIPLAYDSRTHKPLQLDCEHGAIDLIMNYYRELFAVGMKNVMLGKDLPYVPDPEEFKYVFVDEEPELEVTSTADADNVIAHIKEAL